MTALEFIDTTALLYAYDSAAGRRHERAQEVVGRLGRARRAAISVQVIQEFHVNAVRRIAAPLSPAATRERLRVFSRWTVHAPGPEDVLAASKLAERAQLSFWDAMILRSAAELGCGVLHSEDLTAGQVVEGVGIVDPFADVAGS